MNPRSFENRFRTRPIRAYVGMRKHPVNIHHWQTSLQHRLVSSVKQECLQSDTQRKHLTQVSVLTDGVGVKEPHWSSEDCQEHFVVKGSCCI